MPTALVKDLANRFGFVRLPWLRSATQARQAVQADCWLSMLQRRALDLATKSHVTAAILS